MCATRKVAVQLSSAVATALRGAAASIDGELFRVVRGLSTIVSQADLVVLELRLENTLDIVGRKLGRVTRERVRQIESKARPRVRDYMLASHPDICAAWTTQLRGAAAVSDSELFEPWIVSHCVSEQYVIGRICLICTFESVVPAVAFRKRLRGWWTLDPARLGQRLDALMTQLPFGTDQLQELAITADIPPSIPVVTLLGLPTSPSIYSEAGQGWVRRRARHRDAAWLVLAGTGAPIGSEQLGDRLGLVPRVLNANLARDSRFTQLQPTGEWALREWTHLGHAGYSNTLQAVIAVLQEHGPLPLRALTSHVSAVYPVTVAAVGHCLNSELIGRWPDGRIGLAEHGAPHIVSKPRKPPRSVVIRNDGSISFTKRVDHDLLRGSGTGLPRFIGHYLGLTHAPMKLDFKTESGHQVRVARNVSSVSMSTLRDELLRLGASIGCKLEVTFRRDDRVALVRLVCDHRHGTQRESEA